MIFIFLILFLNQAFADDVPSVSSKAPVFPQAQECNSFEQLADDLSEAIGPDVFIVQEQRAQLLQMGKDMDAILRALKLGEVGIRGTRVGAPQEHFTLANQAIQYLDSALDNFEVKLQQNISKLEERKFCQDSTLGVASRYYQSWSEELVVYEGQRDQLKLDLEKKMNPGVTGTGNQVLTRKE